MIKVDDKKVVATVNGREIKELTNIQFSILRELKNAGGCVMSREDIMAKVWGYDREQLDLLDTRTVDVHIARLRRKIANANNRRNQEFIVTVPQRGYRLP